jgi:5,5'-dehydrodivanillate O-demethylase
MISQAMNERLTRVGAGTPCGELMRRYWIPIRPKTQLLENPVQKVRILGEDLVLYRDRAGGFGLIGNRCLQKLVGYPVQELGGLLFAYLGPLPAPALPRWDLFVWPNAIRQIAVNTLRCNWLQCQENTGDPAHSVWVHGHAFQYALERNNDLGRIEQEHHTIHSRLKIGVGIKDLYAEPTAYGMKKGIVYSKELGAEEDHISQHSTVIFPFFTQTGEPGGPRSEYQIRVPIDDQSTYHICYQVYAGPPEVAVPAQDGVPWYEPPTIDENGKPILDYVLAQDALVWAAQGEIVDRTAELLGRTDIPIVFLRRQLDEQIAIVEAGGTPMNVFAESPEIIYGRGYPAGENNPHRILKTKFRHMYHKGYGMDDADRYGPALELVKELHRRIEAAQLEALATADA